MRDGNVLYLLLILLSDEPVLVKLGDPVISLELEAYEDGTKTSLGDIFQDGFVFFLSVDCSKCRSAVEEIASEYLPHFPVLLVFLESKDKIQKSKLISTLDQKNDIVYIGNEKRILELNIKVLPAVLGYKNGELAIAMHGPISRERAPDIIDFYRTYKPRKVN